MQRIHFPKPFERAHPPVRNVNDLEAHNDYEINRKAEEEARAVLDHLSAQDEARINALDEPGHRVMARAGHCGRAAA